jgi:two-component system KDP operon response regulator KdpE
MTQGSKSLKPIVGEKLPPIDNPGNPLLEQRKFLEAHQNELSTPCADYEVVNVSQSKRAVSLTHKMRQSLAMVKGMFTSLIQNQHIWDDKEKQGFLHELSLYIDRIGLLLEQYLLEVSPPEGVNRTSHPPFARIDQLLPQIVSEFEKEIGKRSIALEIPADAPLMEVDSDSFVHTVRDLLSDFIIDSTEGRRSQIVARDGVGRILFRISKQGGDSVITTEQPIFYQVVREEDRPENGSGNNQVVYSFDYEDRTSQRYRSPEVKPYAKKTRILVIASDHQTLRFLTTLLESGDYRVYPANTGKIALQLSVVEIPDVIILDTCLPDMDGFMLCGRLREFSTVPILMITTNTEEAKLIRGLDLGADDYLIKPFSGPELLARLRAILRRERFEGTETREPIFRSGDLTIDFAHRRITVRGQRIDLTPLEYKLLYHLAVNANRVLTHSQLLSKSWGDEYQDETHYLWVNISRLRRKIEKDPRNPEIIQTEPGVGYYLNAP